jgi:hypothetical protein
MCLASRGLAVDTTTRRPQDTFLLQPTLHARQQRTSPLAPRPTEAVSLHPSSNSAAGFDVHLVKPVERARYKAVLEQLTAERAQPR